MRHLRTLLLLFVLVGAGLGPAIAQDGGNLLPITADNASEIVELDAPGE